MSRREDPVMFPSQPPLSRCSTVCRLPSSLQTLSPERPRPRAWLSSDEAWARARREVEERRERMRRQEMEVVEKTRRQQEREQSEAVRVARTKLLDQVNITLADLVISMTSSRR